MVLFKCDLLSRAGLMLNTTYGFLICITCDAPVKVNAIRNHIKGHKGVLNRIDVNAIEEFIRVKLEESKDIKGNIID
jgi:hypothetical protein